VVRLVAAGQHIVAGDDIYGGTSRLLLSVVPHQGIEVTNVDMTDVRCRPRPATHSTRSTSFQLVRTTNGR
jgi:cystathionine beta-lyase